MTARPKPVDVIVCGAGMVGLSAALALLRQDLSVLLLERGKAPDQRPLDAGLRVSALNPASRAWLTRLGAWDSAELAACAYSDMRIWESTPESALCFSAAELNEPRLGDIVSNALLCRALWARLVSLPQLNARFGCSVTQISQRGNAVRARLSDGSSVRCRLLLGTDGSRSAVRDLLGIETQVFDYKQTALVAHLELKSPIGPVAMQRFLDTGPVGMLPLKEHGMSCVWSTSPEQAKLLKSLPNKAFAERFMEASQHQTPDVAAIWARGCFPLRRQDAERYTSGRCALLGDAAHSVHPMAGLGVNLGFADVACLVELVAAAQARDADISARALLRRFARERRSEATLMSRSIHALQRCFMSSAPVMGEMRRFGLRLLNDLPAAKRQLFLRARGGYFTLNNPGELS